MKLSGKVVMITGTSRGLGAALAEAFEQAGATVEGASRSDGTDLTREDEVARWFENVLERHGQVDVLINNSGLVTPRKPLAEVSLEEWEASVESNLTSPFLCTREALRCMIPQESGLIITVSSGVADRPAPTWGPYAAAKWGSLGLCKLVADEVAGEGILLVSVNPGRTRTGMRASAYPDEDPTTVKTPQETAPYFVALAAGEIAFQSGDLLQWEAL